MNFIKCEKLEKSMAELQFSIDAEAFKAAVADVFKKEGKKYPVQGFRKGKAPKALIEKMYGADVFTYDAINELFPAAYEEAVKAAGIEPVGRPEVSVDSASEAEGAALTVKVAVKPEVKIGAYNGLTVEKTVHTVSDEAVEAELKRVQERNARELTREGAAENGDIVDIDFEGFVDGVAFEGGKAEHYSLTLGSGSFIPGFEEQVAGKNIGEDFDVNVTFPEHYQAENLAGKPAVFKCKLHEIKGKELPNVDDEFVKDVSEFDTLDEYKADIKSKLEKAAADEASTNLDNALVDAVIGKMKAEVPQVMYQRRIDEIVREWSARNRISVEDYLKYTGVTMDQFRANFTEVAKRQVDLRLALEKIAELENITVSDEDVEKEYADMAEQYKMDVDKIKAAVPTDAIKNDLKIEKALDLVRDSAKIEEVTE